MELSSGLQTPHWHEVSTGDGGHAFINPLDPSVVFMTYVRGDVFRFVNDGQTLDLQVSYNGTFGESLRARE